MEKEEILIELFQKIKSLNKDFIDCASSIIQAGDKKLYTLDLFASTILNRGISLIYGFNTLAELNNYIAAVPLIRMQVDNALRFFAATLVSDYNDFFLKYLRGTKISSIKDIEGNNLTDNYLAKKLDELFPGIYTLYENTSDFIHLSNKHSYINANIISEEGRRIGIRVGMYDFFNIDKKIDFAFNMQMASKIVLIVAERWRQEKEKINSSKN